MAAEQFDLVRANPGGNFALEQGADYDHQIIWYQVTVGGTPVDLTGYSARMKIKKFKGSATTLASWTSAGGEIVLGGTAGTITFAVTAAATAAYSWVGYAVYDLELVSFTGTVYRLMEGNIELATEVTN